MPELPEETVQRLQSVGLNGRDANFLVSLDAGRTVGYDGDVGAGAVGYFDAVSRELDAKVAFNWYVGSSN
jgi:aspartyl-tRNA(Asn)/glutamyl-tRNA(Gln) amidotransferase subunit B